MPKYEDSIKNVFSIFDSAAWKAENILTFPENFIGDAGNEYIRVTILTANKAINSVSGAGQLMIDIFTTAGNGPLRSSQIADKLDAYLVNKSIRLSSGLTQLFESSYAPFGPDKDNPALYRAIYTIPFYYYVGN